MMPCTTLQSYLCVVVLHEAETQQTAVQLLRKPSCLSSPQRPHAFIHSTLEVCPQSSHKVLSAVVGTEDQPVDLACFVKVIKELGHAESG